MPQSVKAAIVLIFAALGSAFAQPLVEPLRDVDFVKPPETQIELGRLLFYDRALSGSYRVSCATCHNHDRASGNGDLLPGRTEPMRDALATNGANPWAPWSPSSRHAPTLFNLGHRDFKSLFSDGRVQERADGTIDSPAGDNLPGGLSGALAAQALFPTVASDELTPEAPPATVADHSSLWDDLLDRLLRIEAYPPLFASVYSDVERSEDVGIHHVANAIAAFVATEWRSDQAPFDRFLRGDSAALNEGTKRGLDLFNGRGGCNACHSGALLTDHGFHAVGMTDAGTKPEAEKGEKPRWLGRFNVTGDERDIGKVRTPSLRNVALTGPWGLAGQFSSIQEAIKAHQGVPELSADEMQDLLAFLGALTDTDSLKGRLGKPESVPSDLALD